MSDLGALAENLARLLSTREIPKSDLRWSRTVLARLVQRDVTFGEDEMLAAIDRLNGYAVKVAFPE